MDGDIEETTYAITYAAGGFTVGYQYSEEDNGRATTTTGYENTGYGIVFAVNDDLSISVGRQDVSIGTNASDEENTGASGSYTMGSMSFTAFANKASNVGGSAGTDTEAKGVTVSFSF